jgi:light-regulated signal transduction histidine kinase (bacteriophytochrome)
MDQHSRSAMEHSSGDETKFGRVLQAKGCESAEHRELEAFCYSLSHDLRSLLTRIYTASQALRDGYATTLDHSGKYFVQCICEASESMEERIQAMLALSLVTRQEIRLAEVDLSAMATEVMMDLQQSDIRHPVQFVCAPSLSASGDARLLRVVLENLLGNAWKYTKKVTQPRIEFGCQRESASPLFFVRDNGAGFSMSEAHRLFKPFERLHDSREFPGNGIGLATVQRIVERHCGRVWAEGAIGQGATFFLSLP